MTPPPAGPRPARAAASSQRPTPLASEAGVAVMRQGGNALDAAIAAAATIAVVYPHMNGIGGDNVWLIYDAGARAAARAQRRRPRRRRGRSRERIPRTLRRRHSRARRRRRADGSGRRVGMGGGARLQPRRDGSSPCVGRRSSTTPSSTRARALAVSAGQRRVTAAAADLFAAAADADVRRTLWPIYHPGPARGGALRAVGPGRDAGRGSPTTEPRSSIGARLARRIAEAAAVAGQPADRRRPRRASRGLGRAAAPALPRGEAASLPPPTQGFAALVILAPARGLRRRGALRRRSRAPHRGGDQARAAGPRPL